MKGIWVRLVLLVLAALVLTALWRFTPLGDWISPTLLAERGAPYRDSPVAILLVVAVYVVAGLVMVPVTGLIVATGIVFEPPWSFLYAIGGTLTSAAVGYYAGYLIGAGTLIRIGGERVRRVHHAVARRGLLSIAIIRNIPVAPFSLINLVAGTSEIRFWTFLGGTLLGMLPGIAALTLLADRLIGFVRDPSLGTIVLIVILALLIFGGSYILRRWIGEEP